MSVQIAPQIEAMIQERVAAGMYPDADAVLREAMRLLDDHERLQRLRAKIQIGVDQADRGELVDFTPELIEQLGREAEEMFKRGETPKPDVCPSDSRSPYRSRLGGRSRDPAPHNTELGRPTAAFI